MANQAKEKSPDMSVSELLREQAQLLADWNRRGLNSCNAIEVAEQVRRNAETIYKISGYLAEKEAQTAGCEPDIDKIDLKTAELRAKAKLNL